MTATASIQAFLRCLPPPDNRKERTLYTNALAKALGLRDPTVVRNCIRDLEYDTEPDTPMQAYIKDNYALINMYDGDDNDLLPFRDIATYLINTSRYGKRATSEPIEDSDFIELFNKVFKLLARAKHQPYEDILIEYLKTCGDFNKQIQDITDGTCYSSDYFPLLADQVYLDKFCISNDIIRECLVVARNRMFDNSELLEGLTVIDSPAFCSPDELY